MVVSQPSSGTSQPSRVMSSQVSWVLVPPPSELLALQLSRVTVLHPSQVVALKLSRVRLPQPFWLSASPAPPPPPPPPSPIPPAQPRCRHQSNSLSRGPRRFQNRCSPVWECISIQEKDLFHLPWVKLDPESAGGAEVSCGTAMPLPPIQPPAAAAARPATTHPQPKKQVAPKNPAPPPGKRNLQGAPRAGTGPLPGSCLYTSQQQQQQQQQLQPQPPQQPRRSSLTRIRGRSLRNPGAAARPEPEAALPTRQYTINLMAEATWQLLRRHVGNQCGWMIPFGGTGLLPGSQSRAGLNLTSFMKISLLNKKNHYDDEEYEEDLAPGTVDQELVRRCTEWLRGVEEAKREGKLETLPHLYDP